MRHDCFTVTSFSDEKKVARPVPGKVLFLLRLLGAATVSGFFYELAPEHFKWEKLGDQADRVRIPEWKENGTHKGAIAGFITSKVLRGRPLSLHQVKTMHNGTWWSVILALLALTLLAGSNLKLLYDIRVCFMDLLYVHLSYFI
jgi:hypothetical protein